MKFFTRIILLCLLFFGTNATAQRGKFSKEAIDYFLEIALGSEYGNADKVITKWENEVRLYVAGEEIAAVRQELNRVIKELNALMKSAQIREVANERDANLIFFFGAKDIYERKYEPRVARYQDLGFFYVYPDDDKVIQRGSLYLDTERMKANDTRFHFLREELTQVLGLMNDSERYPESIFYQKWSLRNEFSDLDKQVIQMLYSPQIKSGMTAEQARKILENLSR